MIRKCLNILGTGVALFAAANQLFAVKDQMFRNA